jgi:hypothetical protein
MRLKRAITRWLFLTLYWFDPVRLKVSVFLLYIYRMKGRSFVKATLTGSAGILAAGVVAAPAVKKNAPNIIN